MTFGQQWRTVAIKLDLQAPEQRCYWAFAYIQKDLGARLGMTSGLASLKHLALSQASLESPHSFTNAGLFVSSFISGRYGRAPALPSCANTSVLLAAITY